MVAVVNGQNLSQADLKIALSAYRRTAIEELVGQSLLLQAAQKKGLKLPAETEMKVPPELLPDESRALARRLRAQQARRALILGDISEAEKREFYQAFEVDFRRYTLQIVAVKDADEAAALRREVEAGTTLESLIPKYSLNLGIPGGSNRLAHQSLQQLSYRLGPYLAEAVQLLKPGQLSLPVPSPLGLLVFRLESVQGGYAESRQRLEDLMVASDCLALDYELAEQSLVSSVYVPELGPRPEPVASATPELDQHPLRPPPVVKVTPQPVPEIQPFPKTPPPRPAKPLPAPKPIAKSEVPVAMGPFKATLAQANYRLLPDPAGLRLDLNGNHHADVNEPVLVRVTPKGWQAVVRLDSSIDRFTLEQDYGYWVDRQVEGGGWLWVSDQTQRPRDGHIDPDEVRLFKIARWDGFGEGNWTPRFNSYCLGGEILRDEEGRLFHYEQRADYSPRTEVDGEDWRRMDDYRQVNANWKVNHP